MDSSRATRQLKRLQNLAKNRQPTTSGKSIEPEKSVPDDTFEFEWTNEKYSKEEIFSEYLYFLRNLPNFLHSEREKVIKVVKQKLKICEIENSLENFNYENLLCVEQRGRILDQLSIKLGYSLR